MTIIDYSTERPSIAQLKAAGVTTVMRYLGWDGVGGYPNTGKNLTKAEAEGYLAAGISVGLAFEYLANAPALGAEQGTKDGTLAKQQLAALAAPVSMGVYFAVDYDTPDYSPSLPNIPANARAKLGPIGDYFAAINETKGGFRTGVYGGYWVVKRLLDAGLATLAWQTIAWSGGNTDPRTNLLQTIQKVAIAGSDLDIHEGKAADFGQWSPPAPKPPVPAPPTSVSFAVPPGIKKVTVTWE